MVDLTLDMALISNYIVVLDLVNNLVWKIWRFDENKSQELKLEGHGFKGEKLENLRFFFFFLRWSCMDEMNSWLDGGTKPPWFCMW